MKNVLRFGSLFYSPKKAAEIVLFSWDISIIIQHALYLFWVGDFYFAKNFFFRLVGFDKCRSAGLRYESVCSFRYRDGTRYPSGAL